MLVTNFRFKYIVYRVMCAAYQALDVARIHPVRERALRALKETVDYIDEKLPDAIGFETQKELIDYALRRVPATGHLTEFGVYTGGTIRYIAKRIGGRTIHGFDGFQGLPEDWGGFSLDSTAFDNRGRLPAVPANVVLHAGWFQDTLPGWLERNPGAIAFMHVDCDLYSSTKTIFDLAGARLAPGSLILFDEYFNYANWREHEFKALQEFVAATGVRYEYLAYARQQVLVRITQGTSGLPG